MDPGESGNGKGETRNVMRRDAVRRFTFPASRFPALHGEGGIRTPDRGISPYNGLANRRLQPLGHLSNVAALEVSATQESLVPLRECRGSDSEIPAARPHRPARRPALRS